MKKSVTVGILYGFVHFSVEVASFYLLFSRLDTSFSWWMIALLYDTLAFVPQSFFGILTDRFPKLNIGVAGLLLLGLSLGISNDLAAVIVVASGNAMVHIDGAQYTIRGTEGKITPDAIFVGAGSFGVITGQLMGQYSVSGSIFIVILLLMISVAAVIFVHKKNDITAMKVQLDTASDKSIVLITVLAFICVAVRGYIAYAIPVEWKKSVFQSVLLFVCMGAGKILGGVLADKIGFRKVTYLSLLMGLPFLLFGNSNMLLSLTGVALFSMTMPVTVAVLSSVYPERPGFSFGITTLGLFFGTAPAFFIKPETLTQHQLTVIALTVIALPSLITCIKKRG